MKLLFDQNLSRMRAANVREFVEDEDAALLVLP